MNGRAPGIDKIRTTPFLSKSTASKAIIIQFRSGTRMYIIILSLNLRIRIDFVYAVVASFYRILGETGSLMIKKKL